MMLSVSTANIMLFYNIIIQQNEMCLTYTVNDFLKVTGGNRGIGFATVRGLCKEFKGDVYLTGECILMTIYNQALPFEERDRARAPSRSFFCFWEGDFPPTWPLEFSFIDIHFSLEHHTLCCITQ